MHEIENFMCGYDLKGTELMNNIKTALKHIYHQRWLLPYSDFLLCVSRSVNALGRIFGHWALFDYVLPPMLWSVICYVARIYLPSRTFILFWIFFTRLQSTTHHYVLFPWSWWLKHLPHRWHQTMDRWDWRAYRKYDYRLQGDIPQKVDLTLVLVGCRWCPYARELCKLFDILF